MENLFGSIDFCPCSECRSVLSPAAYLVDLLEFLRKRPKNASGKTPLDVLLGRRPDVAALPLTCENTNTVIPYIDLVNEILEYYIANNGLDAGAAYDTGTATTDDLRSEPQHILPDVYGRTLNGKQALNGKAYPLSLPFDLWIETVRGCLNYFKVPLAEVLEVLRRDDNLELFTPPSPSSPYNRAQILAESLGLSPAEYQVMTVIDKQHWYQLYGYPDESTALGGQTDQSDPSRYIIPPLSSAKNLAQRLGVTYQELADLVTTGFLNPKLYALIFQFQRFGISLDDAFRYTGQPGYAALSPQAKTDFEAVLDGITARYKQIDASSTFNAQSWLTSLLPAKYSLGVLVLRDPVAGCDFAQTTLQYADGSGSTPATPLDFLKLNLFVRLWKKLGWTLDETDRALQLFLPVVTSKWGDASFVNEFGAAWQSALVYLAHLNDTATQLNPALGRVGLLPLWSTLPTTGTNPLYAHLFLTESVLNNDPFFDDPAGQFPASPSDALQRQFATHQAVLQGVLGLTSDDVAAIIADAGADITTVSVTVNGQQVTVPGFSLTNLSICYRYSMLAKCLQMSIPDLIALKTLANLNPFRTISSNALTQLNQDVLFTQTLTFLRQVAAIQRSSFTVEDLQYLLRHQFDPIGPYQQDENALVALVQAVATGLRRVQSQYEVPTNVMELSEDLIEQRLSSLFPAPILKSLFALLIGSQTSQASQGGVTSGSAIDPTPFAQESALSLTYDSATQTQTLTYTGLLLDWKKAELLQINNTPLFASLLNDVQQQAQQQALASLNHSVQDLLGVWASLVEYEAVQTGVGSNGLPADALSQKDAAVRLNFNASQQLQWLGYRGVLTNDKKVALQTALSLVNPPPSPALSTLLANLLNDVQNQALPAYKELIGTLLAMWTNVQSFQALQTNVASGNQIDPTVFAAYPEIHLTYDTAAQVQKLMYHGVLTNDKKVALQTALSLVNPPPSPALSTLLANLLNDVQNQALQWFQGWATGLIVATATDLDAFSQPFLGVDNAKKRRRAKAELVKVFLPLLTQKVSRQLVLQTLSTNLGTDLSLTGVLLTDAGLLTDPNRQGKSLLGSFLAVAQEGISVAYYASASGTGNALATGTAATVDTMATVVTADSTNPYTYSGSGSAHFEGYLQVPTDGPYRFFAVLGDPSAQVVFQMNSPDPKALFKNPILPQTPAATSNDEVSGIVQLKGGLPYHFTLDMSHLGANGARVLVQGETLPKGPLSRLILYPQAAVAAFARARILLSKVLQILNGTGLDEREVSYLTANAAQFSSLDLSALPTQTIDDSPDNAAKLFAWFLALADYADLRKGIAGTSDGLTGVFEQVGVIFTEPPDATSDLATPWRRLADLTRRDPQVVRDVARSLKLIQEPPPGGTPGQVQAAPEFGTNGGIRRLWRALQLVQLVGVSVRSLTDATAIVALAPQAPDVVAANLKNAVKARYTPESWRPIAQSIFDPLRRKKRDALVAYLMTVDALNLNNAEQLFEYFLVDPSMEPVVQTSRLRLALSSVQTFIQRCLLNLENGDSVHLERNVAPSAIDTDWWAWMKRYRVWQANREIFLFPENWMEPELRLDKSDLFQVLESAVLQGDVTRDLVEDAFYTYLQGLEARARLDVVAIYLDQPTSQETAQPGTSTLYVVGRTYGHPHQYFYRTYADGAWSAWEKVTANIEGDHMVAVIWRQRLNLFWVTFSTKSKPPDGDPTSKAPITGLTFGDLANQISAASVSPVQVQLHWSEYFQGKWSNPIATGLMPLGSLKASSDFDPRTKVYVHVSKEVDQEVDQYGEHAEHAVKIYLDCVDDKTYYCFRVTSKNGDPNLIKLSDGKATPFMPYIASGVDATLHTGSQHLQAKFETAISADGTSTPNTEPILQAIHQFAVLTCANPVVPPFLDSTEPDYQEAGGLVSPFFFKDASDPDTPNELTFFVQPFLTETPGQKWEGWAIPSGTGNPQVYDPNWWAQIHIAQQLPGVPTPPEPGDGWSIFAKQPSLDWVTNPAVAISYGEAWIAQGGGINVGINPAATNVGQVTLPTGSDIVKGSSMTGMLAGANQVVVVGEQGLQLTHVQALASGQSLAAITNAAQQVGSRLAG